MLVLMENEFFKRYHNDIINVSKLNNHITEYVVEEENDDESVTIYRFKNHIQVSQSKIDKEDLDIEEAFYKKDIKIMNKLSKLVTVGLYCIILANLQVVMALPKEIIMFLSFTYCLSVFKLCKTRFSGITNTIKINTMAKNNILNIVSLAGIAISIYLVQQKYILLVVCIIMTLLAGLKYMLDFIRCNDMSLLLQDKY